MQNTAHIIGAGISGLSAAVRLANGDEAPVGRSYNSGLRALLRRMQAATA